MVTAIRSQVYNQVEEQFPQTIELLKEFVMIPSTSESTTPEYDPQTILKAANFALEQLNRIGFTTNLHYVDDSPPYVIAEKRVSEELPTLLFYSHGDVQPVDRNKWQTDPFIGVERDGRLYGRGASDDKAGFIAILQTLSAYFSLNLALPVNVRVLVEFEEEIGSPHMKRFVKEYAPLLKADALIVVDGSNKNSTTGTLTNITRGLSNLKVTVNALEKPMHSGVYCLAPDPAAGLSKLISSLYPANEIEGILEGAQPLSQEEKQILTQSSLSTQDYMNEATVLPGAQLRGDPNDSISVRICTEPSITVINMNSGDPNGGNVIQNEASCHIGIRILPGQDDDRIAEVVTERLRMQAVLWNMPVKIEKLRSCVGWRGDVTRPIAKKYLESMSEHFSSTAVLPNGGAIPLLTILGETFKDIEIILPGVEDDLTAAHSHNESQDLGLLKTVIKTLVSFLDRVAGN